MLLVAFLAIGAAIGAALMPSLSASLRNSALNCTQVNQCVDTTSGSKINQYFSNHTFWTQSGNSLYPKNSRNVGIGTTSPAHALEVDGDFLVLYNNLITGGYSGVFAGDGTTCGVDPSYVGAQSCAVVKGDSSIHIISNYIQFWALAPIDTGNSDIEVV